MMKQTQAREKTEETVRELTVQESLAISGGIFPNPKPDPTPGANPLNPSPGIPC
jgi:hypothetical protein